ncbi:MAG: hypothetical protein JWN46_3507 [Acidimicrobiales bacterium]|nr:hypothetical protein [Acidimicrobiales bacterium]
MTSWHDLELAAPDLAGRAHSAATMDPPPPPEPFDLFAIDVLELVAVTVEGDELVLDRRSAASGRTRVART